MPVAGLGAAPELPGRHVPRDPVERSGGQLPGKQRLVPAEDHLIPFRVDGLYIQRFVGGNPQSLPLADGIVGDAFVTAQHPAGFIHKVAGDVLLPRVPPDEGRIVPVGDEADVLTVRLPGVEKALPVCQRPHFRLMQNAQRELGVGQLLLGQHIEDIALILAEIHRFFQEIPAVLPLDPGIVARS